MTVDIPDDGQSHHHHVNNYDGDNYEGGLATLFYLKRSIMGFKRGLDPDDEDVCVDEEFSSWI